MGNGQKGEGRERNCCLLCELVHALDSALEPHANCRPETFFYFRSMPYNNISVIPKIRWETVRGGRESASISPLESAFGLTRPPGAEEKKEGHRSLEERNQIKSGSAVRAAAPN